MGIKWSWDLQGEGKSHGCKFIVKSKVTGLKTLVLLIYKAYYNGIY
jgi:hypothetical protein